MSPRVIQAAYMAEATAARYGLSTRSSSVLLSERSKSLWYGSGLEATAGLACVLSASLLLISYLGHLRLCPLPQEVVIGDLGHLCPILQEVGEAGNGTR